MKLCLPLLALALPTAAPAVCPTARDLDTGILFRTLDGDTELFRRVSEDVVLSTYTSGSEESRILLGQGLYVLDNVALAEGELLPDTQVRFSYPMAASEMPRPDARERLVGRCHRRGGRPLRARAPELCLWSRNRDWAGQLHLRDDSGDPDLQPRSL